VSHQRSFSPSLVLALSLALGSATTSLAATATTDPVGYNTVSLLANSDTYVSVPFNRPAAFVGQVSSVSGNTITVAGTPGWTSSQFVYATGSQSNTYYAFIRSGTKEGNYYTVTGNGANTLTIDLAGDTLSGLAADDSISVVPYWTLGTLFPASDAGVSFTATTGLAKKTEIRIPDVNGTGTNRVPVGRYYFQSATSSWRDYSGVDKSDEILIPDSYFIVSNPASVATGTLTTTGNVVTKKFVIPIVSMAATSQDNPVAIPRPVPVSLDDSGLISSGAFVITTGLAIKDQVYVYDNSTAGKNKSEIARYFYKNGAWRKFGDEANNYGSAIIFSPNTAVKIVKAKSANDSSVDWVNTPTY
jgi:uncharacterized protein (TIGR02597 family)